MSNNFSTDLEASSSQFWRITDAAQTGLDFTTGVTFALWVKFESDVNQMLIYKGDASTSESYRFQYIQTLGVIRFQINTNSSTIDRSWTPSTGVWYHVAVTYAAGTTRIFVDGAKLGSDESLTSSITPDAHPFSIGSANGVSNFFDGLINNVLAYSVGLSEAGVAALYGAGAGGCNPSTTDLVSWWFSDNNDGNDLQGSNDLTNNNSATFVTDVPFTCSAAAAGRDGRYLSLCGVGQ